MSIVKSTRLRVALILLAPLLLAHNPIVVPVGPLEGAATGDIDLLGTYKLTLDRAGKDTYIIADTEDQMEFYSNNIERFRITPGTIQALNTSNFILASNTVIGFGSISSKISSPADSYVLMTNAATSDFIGLQLGGVTASFPMIKRSTTNIQARLADDSGYAGLQAGGTDIFGTLTATGNLRSGAAANVSWTGRSEMYAPSDGVIFITYDDGSTPAYLRTGPLVQDPSSDQTLAAGDTLASSRGIMRVAGSGGAVQSTADPTIAAGSYDGQRIVVQGTSANTWEAQDESNNAGSTLELAGGANFVFDVGYTMELIWDSGDSKWYELSRSPN